MFGMKKLNKHPLRCPCCRTSLTDGTEEATIRSRHVRSWFVKIMWVFVYAGFYLVLGLVFQFNREPRAMHWVVLGAALGMAQAGLMFLRDHSKARQID